VKREGLLGWLRIHGCYLKREGGNHSIWTNPATGRIKAEPRHSEVADLLARIDLPGLTIPEIGRGKK